MSWGETLFLKKVIDGKKAFKVSDNVLIDIGSKGYNNVYNKTILTFSPKISGQIRLNYTIKNSSSNGTSKFYVYENGTQISLTEKSNNEETSYTKPITITKGKTYTFVISYDYATLTFKLQLGADIVDGSTFDYTIGEW